MKKLYFLTNGLQNFAGTEKVITQLANELSQKVVIVVPQSNKSAFELSPNQEFVSLNIGEFPEGTMTKKVLHKLKYLIEVNKVIPPNSLVFSFMFDLNLLNIILSTLKANKVIICEHIEYDYHKGVRNILRKFLYKFKNVQLICLTKTDQLKFIKDGINAKVITNFIYRVKSQYDQDSKVIVAIGRLEYQKNFAFLINSFAISELFKEGWRLIIVGEGSEKAMLDDLILRLNLNDSVSIHKFTKNIDEYYKKAAVFCMTSRFEAFPMVLLEAINNALPVLVTNFPTGAQEILGNKNLQIVNSWNEVDYAEHLNKLCNDSTLRVKYSGDNKKLAEQFYFEKIMSQWEELIS